MLGCRLAFMEIERTWWKMECIYYKEALLCTSQEHVIPAALGGIAKLPLGTVSDKANREFSPIELSVLRKSFLAMNRENVGPGKRGSLNVQKVKTPNVRVLQDYEGSSDNYKLGFVFAGQTYMIPQLVMDFDDATNSYCPLFLTTQLGNEGHTELIAFRERLVCFLSNPHRKFVLLNMPFETTKHFIVIGEFQGKWFAATSHKIINMDMLAILTLNDIKSIKLGVMPRKTISNIQQHYQWDFPVDTNAYCFFYLKTAFNACAYFIGAKILESNFDTIRHSILYHTDCGNYFDNFNLSTERKKTFELIPDKGHYVIIESTSDGILAYVGFYAEHVCAKIRLSKVPIDCYFTKMFLCDWQQRKERIVDLSEKMD